MTPQGKYVSGTSFCSDCGQKIYQDTQSEEWWHPLDPCPITKKDKATPYMKDTDVDRELADLDEIDRELDSTWLL